MHSRKKITHQSACEDLLRPYIKKVQNFPKGFKWAALEDSPQTDTHELRQTVTKCSFSQKYFHILANELKSQMCYQKFEK